MVQPIRRTFKGAIVRAAIKMIKRGVISSAVTKKCTYRGNE